MWSPPGSGNFEISETDANWKFKKAWALAFQNDSSHLYTSRQLAFQIRQQDITNLFLIV